jgi:acyl carrier protein phosphodiesterase
MGEAIGKRGSGMNYLAHLYLADPTPESLVGNLLADLIKGPEVAALSVGIQAGVRLHRHVDSLTDRHPTVQRSIARISQRWGWFSGILIDVYYDHILATTWERYSDKTLREFVDRIHGTLTDHIGSVPRTCHRDLRRLIESDRLYSYVSPEGIAEALSRLSHRIRERMSERDVRLELAMPDLRACHDDLANDFHEFFPQLVAFARSQKGHDSELPLGRRV